MLLISSNDSALAFANAFGYKAFVADMNAVARSLGMTSTSLIEPSGLSPENVSTAADLFKLARYIYADDPSLLSIVKTPAFDVGTTTEHGAHDFVNIDPFVYDPHYLGGKTGRTDQAGETMLSMFRLPSSSGGTVPIAIIVMHSDMDERQIDSSVLLGQVLSMLQSNGAAL